MPNYKCGADYIERNLSVIEAPFYEDFDVCAFFDGDSDRIIIKNKNIGSIFDGNYFMMLYVQTLKNIQEKLKDSGLEILFGAVGIEFMNLGLIAELKKNGIKYIRADVGIQNVFETATKQGQIIVFFETNGHGGIYFDE